MLLSSPKVVYVFPAPVCPLKEQIKMFFSYYAKIVPDIPRKKQLIVPIKYNDIVLF
jgi:hypothetical protein